MKERYSTIVKKIEGTGGAKPKRSVSALVPPEVSLPTKKTVPPTNIGAFNSYIYGLQKIGKTSFSMMFPNTLHFMFEPSGKAYSIHEVEPKNWMEFLAYISELEKAKLAGSLTFETFALDTVDLLYGMCSDYVCQAIGVEHPTDANDFGKTWQKVESTFREAMVRLIRVGGVVALSHETEKEIETRAGNKYQSIVPSAPKKCHLVLSKLFDVTGNYYVNAKGKRVLRITPSNEVEAGNRMGREHFHYPDGTPIIEIPMGNSPEESYENYSKAFANKLDRPKSKNVKKTTEKKTTTKSFKLNVNS